MYLHIGRTLGRFHHRVVCSLTGRQTRRMMIGMWVSSTGRGDGGGDGGGERTGGGDFRCQTLEPGCTIH